MIGELRNRFGPEAFTVQATRTGMPVVWVKPDQLLEVMTFLKTAEAVCHAVRSAWRGRTSSHPPRWPARCGFLRFLPSDFHRAQPRHHAEGGAV
ncbi:hypothetical protein M8494_04310 [Serratia ureilytica]